MVGESGRQNSAAGESKRYQIRIKGELRSEWEEWFWGFTITTMENGYTVLTGEVQDQAELFGLLHRIRDLGLPLLSLRQLVDE